MAQPHEVEEHEGIQHREKGYERGYDEMAFTIRACWTRDNEHEDQQQTIAPSAQEHENEPQTYEPLSHDQPLLRRSPRSTKGTFQHTRFADEPVNMSGAVAPCIGAE